jgi:crossover junction endodeoxyribonuclease RuvC
MAGILTADRIILGVDPGTRILGFGLIAVKGKQLELIEFGVINLSKISNQEIKLKKIFEQITALIEEFLPDEMALEAPFYGKNVQSMLKLGRPRAWQWPRRWCAKFPSWNTPRAR